MNNGTRAVGVVAKSKHGVPDVPVTITSYEMGVSVFGEDDIATPGMSTLLKLLFLGGVSAVVAMAAGEDYVNAFSALQRADDVQVVICDSGELAVQQILRSSLEISAAMHRERIAVVGMNGASASELTARAKELNSERMVLVGPDAVDSEGNPVSGVFAAAAVAAAIANLREPAVPLNGTVLHGLSGVSEQYSDAELDRLIRNGVTPLEEAEGTVCPVRGITTRTMTNGIPDNTWRNLSAILIIDDVVPPIRQSLSSQFRHAKNTASTRYAIRSLIAAELENKLQAEIIDDYCGVTISTTSETEDDFIAGEVLFSFAVANGLNMNWFTSHLTI